MDKKRLRGLFTSTIIVIVLLAIDQVTKLLVDAYLMPLGTSYPIWEGVFHLTSVHNKGAAFGMLSDSFILLVSSRIIASLLILYLIIRYQDRWHRVLRLCLLAILAGALGNLIDQLAFGYVRDMFDFRLINFAVFNVADSYITVGAIAMAIFILFTPEGDLIMERLSSSKKEKAGDGLDGEDGPVDCDKGNRLDTGDGTQKEDAGDRGYGEMDH
ncbi:MAG: signal peptidase II [Clostridiales bacterium]|nr:signal peptidase II [Clostridia bacterium]MDI9511919.1 signal peptidase II [Bacillota bacterium]NLH58935.1 signal peptidase II [Clostridiales bacterium]